MFKIIYNFFLLLLGIGISLYGATHAKNISSAFAILALLLVHVAWSRQPLAEACVIIMTGIAGACVESVNVTLGIYEYSTAAFHFALLPTWVVLVWFVTGAAIRHTFRWLSRYLLISPVMGAVLGSLIYYIESKLGVIRFQAGIEHFSLAASVLWALVFPVLIIIGHRMFPDTSVSR
ncbi:MAG: DUF2878 domain-containing protein [Gammaproteobacteria bacterium]|nr:DUF2878 domain-containing protein [Gammaproteobacteria bacterium]